MKPDDDLIREAIDHARTVACRVDSACALEHTRLAEWLEELLQLREKTSKMTKI